MEQHKIERLSELSRLCRQRELTEQEQAERALLRREYADAVKASLQVQLDHTFVVDAAGSRHRLKKKEVQ